jgi:glycosyltransferase involved in cell wall biosynthesis
MVVKKSSKYNDITHKYYITFACCEAFTMIQPSLSPEFILFVLFSVGFLIQMFFYLFYFTRLAFYKNSANENYTPPVTIIICAKNEEDNIQKHLPLIMGQDYPEYEVIVVNDFSTDDTEYILEEYQKKHSNFRAITIKQEGSHAIGKKYPLTLGIKGAKYEIVLLTDADCYPKGKNWIRTMVRQYHNPEKEIVLGYGAYEKRKGLLNRIIRFDTFQIALQYFSYSLAGAPYMGVGRNLSYKTPLFFRNKGFASHTHIPSGDDDLFVQKVANGKNVAIEVVAEGHTVSVVKKRFINWAIQKKRHMTTGKVYKDGVKVKLALFPMSYVLFMGIFITLIILKYAMYVVLSLFFIKFVLQMTIFRKAMVKLEEKDLWLLAPFLELLLIFIYPYIYLSQTYSKADKWK